MIGGIGLILDGLKWLTTLLGPEFIYKTLEKVHIIRDRPIAGKRLMLIIGKEIWSFKKVIRCIYEFNQ